MKRDKIPVVHEAKVNDDVLAIAKTHYANWEPDEEALEEADSIDDYEPPHPPHTEEWQDSVPDLRHISGFKRDGGSLDKVSWVAFVPVEQENKTTQDAEVWTSNEVYDKVVEKYIVAAHSVMEEIVADCFAETA